MTLVRLARLTLALVAALASPVAVGAADETFWYKDLKAASAAARQTDRPIFIDFWADWCIPCKQMDTQVYTNPRVLETLREKFVAVRLHFDLQRDLARRFNVEALPYLVFADSHGTPLLYHHGFLSAADLVKVFDAMPPMAAINALDAKLQQQRNDVPTLLEMARALRTAGFYESSNTYYRRVATNGAAKADTAMLESVVHHMALNCLELRDGAQAVELLERHLKNATPTPQTPDLRLALARAYAMRGLTEQARRSLSSILRDFPESAAASEARALLKTP